MLSFCSRMFISCFFFVNDTATTEIYTSIDTLSLHDALPISRGEGQPARRGDGDVGGHGGRRSEEHTSELQSPIDISYAVFCLKKKNHTLLPGSPNTGFASTTLNARRLAG